MQLEKYEYSKFWDTVTRFGFWRKYHNTLPPMVNEKYLKWGRHCQDIYMKESHKSRPSEWPFKSNDAVVVNGVISREKAAQMSQTVTDLIDQKKVTFTPGSDFHTGVPMPLDIFGEDLLDIFDGPLGENVSAVMGSHFRLEWLDFYRTIPGQPKKSWLWHIDNDPPFVIKVLLYITDSNEENGATHVISKKETLDFFKTGMFCVVNPERPVHLDEHAKQHGITYNELVPERAAGDGMIFSTNVLHKGGEVKSGFRDVMSFLLVPSEVPWREAYKTFDKEYVHKSSGFPRNPFDCRV